MSAATPEATAAGIEILEQGGNAADAAVAVSLALGVTEPAMSGLGGQTQVLLFSPESGSVAINGTSVAPRRTPTDATREHLVGHRATTVPTTVKVLDHLWRRFGSGKVGWPDLVKPAIIQADSGFPLGTFRHRVVRRHQEDLRMDAPSAALFLNRGGALPDPGHILRQPELASTLEEIALGGAKAFYEGELAERIADDVGRHGGWMDLKDLAQLSDPAELPPVGSTYRGFEVWSLPPPGAGPAVLAVLESLQDRPPETLQPGAAGRLSSLARLLHLAQVERARDPAEEPSLRAGADAGEGETTHFSVVDAGGIAVSVSASLNTYFGARTAHRELGFLYNNYMIEYAVGQPGHPFAIGPSAVPFSSMSPTILTRDGKACLVLGSPGSDRIISAVTQVVQLWVDTPLTLQEAVGYPRIHSSATRNLFVEDMAGNDRDWIEPLLRDGFNLQVPAQDVAVGDRNAFFGGIHAVGVEDGAWVGAADPRRDGTVGVALSR